jgi:hypothetical protein
MTAPAAGALRGRPPTDPVSALIRARTRNVTLVGELLEERRAAVALAEEVRARGRRVHLATVAERPDIAAHEAGAILATVDRFLRGRS